MERSVFQVAAAAAPFNGGADYRKETSPAVFDPRSMPHPVVAPRGGRVSASPREIREPLDATTVPVIGVGTEVDWAGNVMRGSSRKHVPAPAESLTPGLSPRTERASHNERKHYEKDIRFQSVDPAATGQPLGVATYQFGPGGAHTAAVWKSESQRLFDGDGTEEYSKSEKSAKKLLSPSYGHAVGSAEAALAEARRRHEGVVTGVSMAALGSSTALRDGMADARPPMRAKGGQNSLLAGIGAKIAVAVPSASDDRVLKWGFEPGICL